MKSPFINLPAKNDYYKRVEHFQDKKKGILGKRKTNCGCAVQLGSYFHSVIFYHISLSKQTSLMLLANSNFRALVVLRGRP